MAFYRGNGGAGESSSNTAINEIAALTQQVLAATETVEDAQEAAQASAEAAAASAANALASAAGLEAAVAAAQAAQEGAEEAQDASVAAKIAAEAAQAASEAAQAAGEALLDDVYTKGEADDLLDLKANASDVTTALGLKLNATNPSYTGTLTGGTINSAANPLVLQTGGAERMRINSSGDLLVGTTSRIAGERLSVTASGSGNSTCVFKFDSTDDRGVVLSLHAGASGGISRKHYVFLDAGGFERGSIGVNGSSTSYVTSSDYRLKENIAPMTGALGVVQLLKPCTYTWKNGGIAGQGFIAHELQEVVPECVTGEKDAVDEKGNPKYQGIDTSFLVATLTAAIQEQQALITSLTARLVALENK